MKVKEKTRIKSVSKAIQILEILAKNPKGLLIKEISIELKINLSTTYHLINTLLDYRYVNKLEDDVYILGYQIPFLHNAFLQSQTSHSILNTHLQELSNVTQETVYLGQEVNGEIILTGIIECPQAIKVNALYIGYKDYTYARALPKSIMAFWSDEKIKEYFKGKTFEKITESTPSSLDELMDELIEVKKRGYCLDEQGFTRGICCIAFPVFDAFKNPIASYSIAMPYERYKQHKEEYIKKVSIVAKKASKYFGHYE
ncbi:IclR family transcriptional regulator [Bacillus alveayuensis]|uniref:IclR family transcriptional regulator n=1 Tax=Aeribacillus alveayuensis TaxID=279215 RepID=UPI0005CDAC4F|nr:IclR family transcriptional regulator [Bacillus alveayuensis]